MLRNHISDTNAQKGKGLVGMGCIYRFQVSMIHRVLGTSNSRPSNLDLCWLLRVESCSLGGERLY